MPPFRQPPQPSGDFAATPLPTNPARPATPSTGELDDCCWSRGMFSLSVGSAGDGFEGESLGWDSFVGLDDDTVKRSRSRVGRRAGLSGCCSELYGGCLGLTGGDFGWNGTCVGSIGCCAALKGGCFWLTGTRVGCNGVCFWMSGGCFRLNGGRLGLTGGCLGMMWGVLVTLLWWTGVTFCGGRDVPITLFGGVDDDGLAVSAGGVCDFGGVSVAIFVSTGTTGVGLATFGTDVLLITL